MAPRASELIPSPQDLPLTEMDILTGCPCGRLFRLDECTVDDLSLEETIYYCPTWGYGGCQVPVLIVSVCNEKPRPTAAWQFGEWQIRNPFDVISFKGTAWTKLPAKPRALE